MTEGGPGRSGPATSSRRSEHDASSCHGIGIDFGGTTIKAGIVEAGRIVRHASLETPRDAAPGALLDAVASLLATVDAPEGPVGIAIPGEVDEAGRVWRLPNVTGFEGITIAAELARRTGRDVAVENDATAAALGELLHGAGGRFQSFALLTLGTGIGGGLVLDGRIRRGAHGFAGEFGHVLIDHGDSAAPCVCGQRGCVEAYAGTRALLARHHALGGTSLTIRDVAVAARADEPAARAAFRQLAEALAAALTSIQNVLDLEAIVFSGGVSESFALFEADLRASVRARAFARPLGEVPLVVSDLGAHAGIVGAAHLASAV